MSVISNEKPSPGLCRPLSAAYLESRLAANHSANLLKVWLILCDVYPTLMIHRGIYGAVCSYVAHLALTIYKLASVGPSVTI